MQEIFLGEQVKKLDSEYIEYTGISSHELMERVTEKFVAWFLGRGFSPKSKIFIAAGKGNNGGDGLGIARMLSTKGFEVILIKLFESEEELSPDSKINFELLPKSVKQVDWKSFKFNETGILIDSFLGVGLKGELRESAKKRIDFLNGFEGKVISVDMPSGLPSDEYQDSVPVKADITVTFQFPKLSLLVPDYAEYIGELVVLDVGIIKAENSELMSDKYFLQAEDLPIRHRKFHRFSYKGDFGKIFILGGSPGKMGALFLAGKSALRTGAGLVTCHLEESERSIIQGSLPEAMCTWGEVPDLNQFDSIAIGPGWGTSERKSSFEKVVNQAQKPLVLDADALNLLAENPDLLKKLPENSILTPHLGEFRRLAGESRNHFDRIEKAKQFAQDHHLILILKGAHTLINLPDGRQIFNSSGIHYMGTGGAGDVLTGMIAAFLGMGYSPENSAICAVFHHGLAGELAAKTKRRGLIASDIIEAIPETYLHLKIY